MSAELTDEERAMLNCDCYRKWGGYHVEPCVVPVVHSIISARARRALEDAADAMGKQLDTFAARGANTRARWAENWLRARAAAVAPRETKD